MNYDIDTNIVPNDWNQENAIIKVVGVGGGGCNAVNYMYRQNIQGCSFIVCNTDAQALQSSEVPVKIQMGQNGLGAGTDPTAGRNAALEAQDEIARKVLDCGTQMLFITAGMGGGTGTGASPVIAKMAKDRGILTVAVVTIPFKNEGNESQSKAVDGIHELEKNVDSLLIINNEKLYQFFGDTLIQEAFPKADEVLATAVRGIIEVISRHGYINVDFQDVCKMMRNSGMALMGSGEGTGPNRLQDAVRGAFESPLLNDFDLKTANERPGEDRRHDHRIYRRRQPLQERHHLGRRPRIRRPCPHHGHRHGFPDGPGRPGPQQGLGEPGHHRRRLRMGNAHARGRSVTPGHIRHHQDWLQQLRQRKILQFCHGEKARPLHKSGREEGRSGKHPGHPAETLVPTLFAWQPMGRA